MKLNFNEFIDLCKENYNNGGDGFVECYEEDTYYAVFPNGLTYEEAIKQIAISNDIEMDIIGY